MTVAEVQTRWDDGVPKLWTLTRALHLRKEMPGSFGAEAEYVPVEVTGSRPDHVIAFLRGRKVATVVPRLSLRLKEQGWGDTAIRLPPGTWKNRLTEEYVSGDEMLQMSDLLGKFPVALFVNEENSNA